MREATFINRNRDKWTKLENILSGSISVSPDELSELFIELTDDLSYARTFYPQSNITQYLNNLSFLAHKQLYKNKKEKTNRFNIFWGRELPLLVYKHQDKLMLSFLIFLTGIFIGTISAANDTTFVRLILGDTYVNQTLDNIQSGEPMAIYSSQGELNMFFAITLNNIKVAFYAFAAGVFLSFGTAYILLTNGIMLGSFQYFFYDQDLLLTSALTIWIHGTLEIAAIIIAGCAGLVIGNSVLFPGTYSRKYSFQQGAKQGMKIVVGLVPIFMTAGFLEGFVTRHSTDLPIAASLSIIIGSLLLIIYYFIIYPIRLTKQINDGTQ